MLRIKKSIDVDWNPGGHQDLIGQNMLTPGLDELHDGKGVSNRHIRADQRVEAPRRAEPERCPGAEDKGRTVAVKRWHSQRAAVEGDDDDIDREGDVHRVVGSTQAADQDGLIYPSVDSDLHPGDATVQLRWDDPYTIPPVICREPAA